MKSNLPQRRIRQLRAKAAVAPNASLEDYELEPNMKLSHAFLVVLALHVVAVGGLFAFNKVKAHRTLPTVTVKTENTPGPSLAAASQAVPPTSSPATTPTATPTVPVAAPIASTGGGPGTPPPTSPTPVTPPVVAPTPSAPAPTSETAPQPASTGPTTEYTIVKGDNPYEIAKRFHVSYDSLMKLNNITDPRKIQIGQKLQIPAPLPATTHKASTTTSHKASTGGAHKTAKKVKKKS